MSREVLLELEQIIESIENDNEIICAIITGCGKSFVAGADISEMINMNKSKAKEYSKIGSFILRKIETSKRIFIVAVNGYAFGGGSELAMACDLRVASNNAKFGQLEIILGIIPGVLGTQRLSRIVGITKAKELIYTGQIIDSTEALQIGLINKIVSSEYLMNECIDITKTIVTKPYNALLNAKESINNIFNIV